MLTELALSQHPMYFLIKEDELCAERTPPWGAPDVAAYIERLRQNFAALRRHPQLKVGFEWSALELEQLAQDAPDVFREMMDLADRGQIAFYNGTYAQPHLQTLSAEANYRQFEFGARVYRRLCRRLVRVYAHQETSFNEQTPQLLQAFGIQFMVLPHFLTTLVLEGVEVMFHPRAGATFVQGSEFARWRGLDGTTINTYLRAPAPHILSDWLEVQRVKGQLGAPPILVDSPDLISIDEHWLAERAQFEFVLLDEALPRRLQQAPARGEARIFANWSYIEGIRAEELARANWLAERAALRAEALSALAFVLVGRQLASTQSVWQTILTAQHHDVYCFCAPDLKRKSIGWLRQAEDQAQRLAQAAVESVLPRISATQAGGEPLVIFNTVPHSVAAPVSIVTHVPHPALRDGAGQPVACDTENTTDGVSRLTFVAQAGGLGYASYVVTTQDAASPEADVDGVLDFENPYYRAVARPDGALASLRAPPAGPELLDTRQMGGGALAGDGLQWRADGPPSLRRSALGLRLCAPGRLAAGAKVCTTLQFYVQLPWIDLTWDFEFEAASLGSFFDDDSKLRVQFPLAFRGHIYHDIAFGVTTSLEDRPFFPAGWVDVSDGARGLAYFHQGTPKHWFAGQVLNNLFAWGEDTDAIGNRLGRGRWPKRFDQRLNGRHRIRAALYPHPGDWRVANTVGQARSFANPPLVYLGRRGSGSLPPAGEVFELVGQDLAATSVFVEDDQMVCRFYSFATQLRPVAARLEGLTPAGLSALDGRALDHINPYQIAHLRLARQPGSISVPTGTGG